MISIKSMKRFGLQAALESCFDNRAVVEQVPVPHFRINSYSQKFLVQHTFAVYNLSFRKCDLVPEMVIYPIK